MEKKSTELTGTSEQYKYIHCKFRPSEVW